MFRYMIDLEVHRLSKLTFEVQFIHGLHCLSKRYHPTVVILEPVLFRSLRYSVP